VAGELFSDGEFCQNCQAPLHGKYCSECGQRHEPHIHSVSEFAAEAVENVTHADSRLWRTLWLLVSKPGFLTREFFEGRRVSYLPPFRLYLVLSVITFLTIAVISHESTVVVVVGEPEAAAEAAARAASRERNELSCRGSIGFLSKEWENRFFAACRRAVADDGRAFSQAIMQNIPRALFLSIPLLALVMRAMYWRRRYVEHLLFFVHNHAFDFVLFTVLLSIMAVIPGWGWLRAIGVLLLIFYPPIYAYKAMRRVYPQNKWITRLKFVVLSFAYGLIFFVLALFTGLFSLLTL
jgi:hypothetical protein